MPSIRVVAAIIERDGKFLITKRPSDVHLAGLWEFPGGKVEPNESLEQALAREIDEEIGVKVEVLGEYFHVEHSYATKSVDLHFFDCAIINGDPKPLHVADMRWVSRAELENFSFPEADRELISRLRARRPRPCRPEC
jgi:8-oxo-dGTP diphosphatase